MKTKCIQHIHSFLFPPASTGTPPNEKDLFYPRPSFSKVYIDSPIDAKDVLTADGLFSCFLFFAWW
jgi:hypothetical protein